jgi:hypothetical protein
MQTILDGRWGTSLIIEDIPTDKKDVLVKLVLKDNSSYHTPVSREELKRVLKSL